MWEKMHNELFLPETKLRGVKNERRRKCFITVYAPRKISWNHHEALHSFSNPLVSWLIIAIFHFIILYLIESSIIIPLSL